MSELTTRYGAAGRSAAAAAAKGESKDPYRAAWILVFLYLIVEFVRPQALVPALAVVRPGLLLIVPLLLFSLARLRDPVYKDTLIRLVIAFSALGLLSVWYAGNTRFAFNYSIGLFLHVFALIVPLCVVVTSLKRLETFIFGWIGLHVYLAVYGMVSAGRGPGSFVADENDLSLALNCALPFVYFLYRSEGPSKRTKLLLALALVVILAGTVSTFSRGGFVGLAATAAALVWMSRNRFRNGLIICFMGLLFFIFMPSEYKEEMSTISDPADTTRVERFDHWYRATMMFLDHPIAGVGFGNYPWNVADYEGFDPDRRGLGGRVSHSVYFTLLPETGIVGVLLFTCVGFGVYRRNNRTLQIAKSLQDSNSASFLEAAARATSVGLLAYLATGAFISVLYYPQFWYLAGFSYVIHRNAAQLAEAESLGRA